MKEQESTRIQEGSAATKLEIDLELDRLMDELALKIREKQRLRNWNNDVLVSKVTPNISRAGLINVMMGRGNPTLKTLLTIAKALGYGIRVEFTRP